MKILVIGSDPRIFDAGSENFRRVKEYAGLFDELHILSSAQPGAAEFRSEGLFLYPIFSSFPLSRWFRMVARGRKIASGRGIDLVDAQDAGEHGMIAFYIARAAGIPFRVQIHTDIMSPHYRSASWKERIRYHLARFLLPRSSCLRVVSERIRRSIETRDKRQETRISVLPIFTDVSAFLNAALDPNTELRFKNYDFKMVAVGRFVDKEKNFSMLIDAMPDIVTRLPGALLVLVGDGTDKKNYESRIRNKGLEKYVMIEQWRDDLPSFYKSFDLFVSPSNYEGWGRAVIEAMAAGLPIVMTDVGLAGEVIRNDKNGIVVPVGDSWAFAGAIIRLARNPDLRRRFADAARKTAHEYGGSREEYLARYKKNMEQCGNHILR